MYKIDVKDLCIYVCCLWPLYSHVCKTRIKTDAVLALMAAWKHADTLILLNGNYFFTNKHSKLKKTNHNARLCYTTLAGTMNLVGFNYSLLDLGKQDMI